MDDPKSVRVIVIDHRNDAQFSPTIVRADPLDCLALGCGVCTNRRCIEHGRDDPLSTYAVLARRLRLPDPYSKVLHNEHSCALHKEVIHFGQALLAYVLRRELRREHKGNQKRFHPNLGVGFGRNKSTWSIEIRPGENPWVSNRDCVARVRLLKLTGLG